MMVRSGQISDSCKKEDLSDDRAISTVPATCKELDKDAVVHCQLFGDLVTDHVCVMRRYELNERGGFSCSGCIVDMVINRPKESVRDSIRVYNS